jgi:hypothetical protein
MFNEKAKRCHTTVQVAINSQHFTVFDAQTIANIDAKSFTFNLSVNISLFFRLLYCK